MATDWWPEQNGRLTDGLTIMCNAEAGGTEGSTCKFGTSTASQIRVADSSAFGDGWGIQLKATSAAGDAVPVLVYGLFKSTYSGATTQVTQGGFVMNSITTSTSVIGTFGANSLANLKLFGGGSYVLGMAMQTVTATADKYVLFVGKCM